MTDSKKKMADLREKLESELRSMGESLSNLRLQANLGKMELKQKLEELGGKLDSRYRSSKESIETLAREGADEGSRIAKSLQAGWKELLATHRELSEKAEREAKGDRKPS